MPLPSECAVRFILAWPFDQTLTIVTRELEHCCSTSSSMLFHFQLHAVTKFRPRLGHLQSQSCHTTCKAYIGSDCDYNLVTRHK